MDSRNSGMGVLGQLRERWVLVVPAAVWYALFLLTPLIIPVFFSLTETYGAGGPNVENFPSLANYARLADEIYRGVFVRTFGVAVGGTVTLLLIAFPMAYYLATRPRRWKFPLLALIVIPAWASLLVRTYAWIILLGSGGPVQSVLSTVGWIDTPIRLLFTPPAVWIGLVYIYLPIMVLSLWVSLERLDRSLLEASSDLGAGGFYTFRHVTLPLALPGIVVGTILVFIPLCGEYVIPQLLGGQKVILIGQVIVSQFRQARDWAFGAAVGLALVTCVIAAISLYLCVLRSRLRRVSQ